MVDEYPKLPKISVDWRSGSDSSMVDEYEIQALIDAEKDFVQIPLWSMNTRTGLPEEDGVVCVQIPLWSMNTRPATMLQIARDAFRFLYGR